MAELYEVTVKTGEDIRQVITDYVLEKGWESVYVIGAIGSVIDMSFTAPIENTLPLRTASTPCNGAAELVALTGEVMLRERMDPALATVYTDTTNPLFVHLHACCATAGGHMMGGGLKAGKAFRAVRVFMTPIQDDPIA